MNWMDGRILWHEHVFFLLCTPEHFLLNEITLYIQQKPVVVDDTSTKFRTFHFLFVVVVIYVVLYAVICAALNCWMEIRKITHRNWYTILLLIVWEFDNEFGSSLLLTVVQWTKTAYHFNAILSRNFTFSRHFSLLNDTESYTQSLCPFFSALLHVMFDLFFLNCREIVMS